MSTNRVPRNPKHPHVAKATAYAKGVVAGKILACKWVRLACRRHLDDVKRSKAKDYPFTFNAEKAERACVFAEKLPHVKGKWAIPKPGDPDSVLIRLEPFQCFRRSCLFGWVEKATGWRRFRESYEERPRKNAKSTDTAIDGLFMFAADGEMGAEVYSGATSEDQAWEVFRPARWMAERTEPFREFYGVEVHAKSLSVLRTGSRFQPVIGKPGDGASPSCSITDEYHEHADSTQYDTMISGMGARNQPLALVITTAGDNLAGPCYAMRDRAIKMLEGIQEDERLFAIIYTIDDGDDWTTEEALRKANPNYGVSVSAEYLKSRQQVAVANSRDQGTFKTKHLNLWLAERDAWLNMEWWHRCADTTLRPEDFAGEAACFGADLASRLDLASVARIIRREVDGETHYYAFGRHYAPRASVEDPKNRHYMGWAEDGWLTATEGNDIDYDAIAGDIHADAQVHGMEVVGVDPWNGRALTDKVIALGADPTAVIEVPQNVKFLSPAMKDLEAAVKSGRFHHNGDPVLTWAMSNVTVREDPNGNIFPRKERQENKIDPAVALIIAASRAFLPGATASVYETRGVYVPGGWDA